MRLFRRRPRLPVELRPALSPGERVLAWAAASGGAVVATNLGLFLPGFADRLGWHEIHKATWSGEDLSVVPATVVAMHDGYDEMADRPASVYRLPDPGDLPDEVRARVIRSVAYSTHHRLPGGGVRVVARRVPGVDGLRWAVRYDLGTPRDETAAASLVAAARAST